MSKVQQMPQEPNIDEMLTVAQVGWVISAGGPAQHSHFSLSSVLVMTYEILGEKNWSVPRVAASLWITVSSKGASDSSSQLQV